MKRERQHVYRYLNQKLYLSQHRVISRGKLKEFGSGLLNAATAVAAGAALYSHATNGREDQLQEQLRKHEMLHDTCRRFDRQHVFVLLLSFLLSYGCEHGDNLESLSAQANLSSVG